jgi:hypothetical protein
MTMPVPPAEMPLALLWPNLSPPRKGVLVETMLGLYVYGQRSVFLRKMSNE